MGTSSADLTELPLKVLISDAQDDPRDDSLAMNEIVRRFERLAWRIARSLTNRADIHDAMCQEALIAVTHAVRRHQRGRRGFITYAKRYMDGAARREMADWVGPGPASLADPVVWSTASAIASPPPAVGLRCWGYGPAAEAVKALPVAQRELLTQRYVDDVTVTAIAGLAGTSVPAVSKRLAKCHRAVAERLAA